LIGRVLGGRYRLESRRGVGSSSEVYLATDQQLDRTVAVKILDPELTADPEAAKRIRAESQVAASLDHPNIVRVEDWGQEEIGGRLHAYLVLEHLAGGSLQEMLDRGRLLSPSQALVVGLDVCRGLDYAHRRGLVHHDIRPGVILFGEDRRARIADFGIARALSERAWSNPTLVDPERARYASPEQGAGRPVDERTDVYSLCLTLIESVTGQVPFVADSVVATLAARVDKLMPVSADLGPLASVLEKAGRSDPAERSTAAELGRGLVQAAEKLPRPAPIAIVGAGLFAGDATGSLPRPLDAPASRPAPTAPITLRDEPGELPEEPVDKPHVLRWVLAAVALLVVLVGGVVAWRALSATSHEVPNLVGMDKGEALNAIAGFDWDVVEVPEASETVPVDVVIRTDPVAGTSLREGGEFALVFSTGPAPRVLPEIAGLTVEEATLELGQLDLGLEVVAAVPDEDVPEGVILTWAVPEQPTLVAGDDVVRGTTIHATISSGPAPRTVPSVIGLTYRDAVAELEGVQLRAVRGDDVFSDDIPPGAVAAQSVAAGEQVERGSTVELQVSKGPDLVAVPDLAGLDCPGVTNALQGAGLTVGDLLGVSTGLPVSVTVDGRPVQAGELLRRGTPIDLICL
jgi:serine/threonine-protein kinase